MSRLKDRTGEVYGKLTIVQFYERKNGKIYWKCKCECGKSTVSCQGNLHSGNKKSCGCLRKDSKLKSRKATTHGMTGTRFHRIWISMKRRCSDTLNRDSPEYKIYAGRGIEVCERWKEFLNFKADMYDNYLEHARKYGEENTSIDRKDVNKGYNPENCRWATWEIQGNNRTNNRRIYYKGKKYTLSSLAKEHGLSPSLFISRLHRGWDTEKALNAFHESPGRKVNNADLYERID